ncbi:MAG: fumarylacetoacetate hydrolase family protein [Deltaproteobacteria bacterium]|nr:MAG: fumarylacetoacetate hydrolase family protein [Deltaproteobacteria bacterium]
MLYLIGHWPIHQVRGGQFVISVSWRLSMKICHYNNSQVGVVVGDQVYNIGDALIKAGLARQGYTMLEIIDALANNPAAMQIARDAAQGGGAMALGSVKLRAPITNPGSLWAAAANYYAHRAEMVDRMGSANKAIVNKDDLMAEFFLKTTSSIIGPGDTIILPKISKLVDFECELCAVIGKRARKVSEAQSLDHVFGYMMCWDISQRDPWGKGMHNTRNIRKGFDTFSALGPWIVTRDEIDEPQNLSITVLQNGKEAMTAHTSDMICGLREHIRFLSSCLTLRPGDLITTGTPAGVSKLHDGDRLHGTIEKIGSMELFVKDEE